MTQSQAEAEVSPHTLPMPLPKQCSVCAETAASRNGPRGPSMSPRTAAQSCGIDDSGCVSLHMSHCIPRHRVRSHFHLCYPNLQDLFVCRSKWSEFTSPAVPSGMVPSTASHRLWSKIFPLFYMQMGILFLTFSIFSLESTHKL